MKSIKILLSITMITFMLYSCEKDLLNDSLYFNAQPNLEMNLEAEGNTPSFKSGFDEWGFNFTANLFDGYLINAMIADPAFQGMPHYRKKVYKGEGLAFWDELLMEYPYFIYILPEPYLIHTKMQMKWNDELLSESAVYPPTWVDSGAWIEFKYTMHTDEQDWRQSRKLVGVSSDYYLNDGVWYNSENKEVGKESIYWPQLMIIQVENQGENPYIPHIMPADYKSPYGSGFGKY